MIDVERIRAQYPALSDGWAYLDAAAGSQVPQSVIDAVAAAWTRGIGNHGGAFAASARSDSYTDGARQAVADLVGAPDPEGVLLGPDDDGDDLPGRDRPVGHLGRGRRGGADPARPRRATCGRGSRPPTRAGATVRFVDPVLPSLDLPAEQFADAHRPAHEARRADRCQQRGGYPSRGARGLRRRP